MQCPHCTAPINKSRGLSVTCGKSECQEAEFRANQERNKPKKRTLKPKEGALKADGTQWTNQPGGIQKLEVPVPTPTSNEAVFAHMLVAIAGDACMDVHKYMIAQSLGIEWTDVSELFTRARAVVTRLKNKHG